MERVRGSSERHRDRRHCVRGRLTLLDALILVAATAIGLAVIRMSEPKLGPLPREGPGVGLLSWGGLEEATRIALRGQPVLAAWTLTLAALFVRRSWSPALRRDLLQPGPAACVVASLGLAICTSGRMIEVALSRSAPSDFAPLFWTEDDLFWRRYGDQILHGASRSIGLSVLGAWALLALARRLRCGGGGIDRVGIMVGLVWIALGTLSWWVKATQYVDLDALVP